ncbi:MAG: BCCT family transporter [Synergistaceae bacterium]|nr:BCCT family transporter [Synergistaceae bacterium]
MKMFDKVDKTIFFSSIIISIALVTWNGMASSHFTEVTGAIFNAMNGAFGWLFMAGYNFFVVALLALALSKYGKVRLCKNYNDAPQYKLMTWVAMMFASGLGVGLTYYGIYVTLDHYYAPPFALAPQSSDAWRVGMTYATWYHALHPWAGYAIVGLIIAYFAYNRNVGGLFSTPLVSLFGTKNADGTLKTEVWYGKLIDVYVIILTLVGICASYAIACAMIGSGLHQVFDIEHNMALRLIILAICSVILCLSCNSGVSKGMALMSDWNLRLCYLLMAMVVVFGPTVKILKGIIQGFGDVLIYFIPMSFFMDATGETQAALGWDFARDWPVMLLAFFMAWTPFVGIFIAKVSRGRTIREFVFGAIFLPALFALVWNTVIGTSAIVMDLGSGGGLMKAINGQWSTCLFVLFQNMPLTIAFSVIALILCVTFILTSCDSGDYCISVLSCRGEIDPPAIVRVVWAIVMGGFATIFVVGGAKAIQNIQGIAALPMFFLIPLMFIAFMRAMRADYLNIYRKQIRLAEIRELKELDDSITDADRESMGYTH